MFKKFKDIGRKKHVPDNATGGSDRSNPQAAGTAQGKGTANWYTFSGAGSGGGTSPGMMQYVNPGSVPQITLCPQCGAYLTIAPGATVLHSCSMAQPSVTNIKWSIIPPGPLGQLPAPPPLPFRKLEGIDYVMAFRTWNVNLVGTSDALLLGHNGTPWLGQPAEHRGAFPAPVPEHLVPNEAFCCGYYGYMKPISGQPVPRAQIVAGVCKMWGRIVRHGDGYRAQYAKPVALIRDGWHPRIIAAIAEGLGVPHIATSEQLTVAREHGYVWGDPLPGEVEKVWGSAKTT